MPKQIIIVRHGETQHNKEKRLMNWHSDVGLSETGKREAAQVGARLSKMDIDAMYVSDLRRTCETGAIIAELIHLKPIETPFLRERNLGKFGDMTLNEIKDKWPDLFDQFIDDSDLDWNGLEGESLRELHTRFSEFLAQLSHEHKGDSILLVSHSGFLYTNIRDVLGLLPPNTRIDVEHTSITILEKIDGSYQLKVFNDTKGTVQD